MRNITTVDHVTALILAAKAAERTECIVKLSPTGANASKAKAAQRTLRACEAELNRHLKDCVNEVKTIMKSHRNIRNYRGAPGPKKK